MFYHWALYIPELPAKSLSAKEMAEEYAYAMVMRELQPKIFSKQISGQYCQTEIWRTKLGVDMSVCLYKKGQEWHVESTHGRDIRQQWVGQNLSEALTILKETESFYKNDLSQTLVSKKSLGRSHYHEFAQMKGMVADLDGGYHKASEQGHMMEQGSFLMKEFASPKTPFTLKNVEGYIEDIFKYMADMAIYEAFSNDNKCLEGGKDHMFYVDIFEDGQKMSKLAEELEVFQRGFKVLQTQKIDGKTGESFLLDYLRGKLSYFHSRKNTAFCHYLEAEFDTLKTYTKCDWSKVRPIREILSERLSEIYTVYNKAKRAHKKANPTNKSGPK